MISSTIWDKSAQANFSKTNQIARAPRASAICGRTSAVLAQIVREKSCDYLLIICHLTPFVTVPSSRLQMTTSTMIGQNFDRWILMAKNAAARNLFIEKWSLLTKIPLLCRGGSRIFSKRGLQVWEFKANVPGPRNGVGEGWEWDRVTKVRVMFEYVSEEFEALFVIVIGLSGVWHKVLSSNNCVKNKMRESQFWNI